MQPSSNTHKRQTLLLPHFLFPHQLTSFSLLPPSRSPLSSLLSSPHALCALPLLCHFSCLPFPSSPWSHPPSSTTQLDHLSCRHQRPAHFPALLISPAPPPLLLSLSGRCVTVLLLSSCLCGPSYYRSLWLWHWQFLSLFYLTLRENQVIMLCSLKKNSRGEGKKWRTGGGTSGMKGFEGTVEGRDT